MDIKSYSTGSDFLAAAGNLLRTDEVRYGLIYSIARLVAANLHHYGDEVPQFYIVFDDTGISTLAWRTPPYLVGVAWHAGDTHEAVSLLIGSIRRRWPVIPGVTGHREVADVFAEKWSKEYETSIKAVQSQRTYRLDSVNDIPEAPGLMRSATLEDRELVFDWTRAFAVDTNQANQEADRAIGERLILSRIENGEIKLWEDAGRPVSMAAKIRPTDHGMSVGLVYTPPGLRRMGYATTCVAGVCRETLKSGYDFCTLSTDLSNPTSNSIYMKIGFRPVCDSAQYTFSNATRG
jgi:predicted GNAT family acetyltransferase